MTHFEQRTEKTLDSWLTPEWVLELVRKFGPIMLDPCTEPSNPTKAEWACSAGGLEYAWHVPFAGTSEHVIYVNPPYGRALGPWSKKIVDEAAHLVEQHMFVLVPARTETDWFGHLFDNAQALGLFRKRIKFAHPTRPDADSPAFPNAMFYFGSRAAEFKRVFEPVARVVTF